MPGLSLEKENSAVTSRGVVSVDLLATCSTLLLRRGLLSGLLDSGLTSRRRALLL